MIRRIAKTFENDDFVWMGNKDTPDSIFGGRGHRLPNSPHGLNHYQHIHNVAVLSALNPPPAHFAFLDALGFDSREVKRAGYWQAVYQAVMRGSPRNPEDMYPKTVIVMDRATADWLASMFPGCAVEALGGIDGIPAKGTPGRRNIYDCEADRKRAHRDQFKSELRIALDLVVGGERAARHRSPAVAELRRQMSEFGFGEDTTLTVAGRANLDAIGGTVYASIYHAEPLDFFPLDDVEAFIDGLRYFHQFTHTSKEMNGLISPAIFDPSLSDETSRGIANIRAVWGIWLDNDGGDLTHDEFARLFPRLRMIIVNSYSSTPEKPRWRVFIPTTVAMPIAAHRAIAQQIMRTLNRDGYWSKKQLEVNERIKSRKHHGFDMSKLVPSSLFYLPCQARDPANSFFIDHDAPGRQPLDPYVWAGYAANHHRPAPEPVEMVPTNVRIAQPAPPTKCPKLKLMRDLLAEEEAIRQRYYQTRCREAAIGKWRSAEARQGNDAFLRLGRDLNRSGANYAEISSLLWQEAALGRHPKERQAQIKYIMRSLRSSPQRLAA